jgi:hypothetical protein
MAAEERKIQWEEQRVKDNDAFRELLKRKSVHEKLFGEKFIDGLERRRDGLEERARKLSAIQLTLTLLLAVSLLIPNMPIAVFGLSSSAGSFREFLLVVVGSLPIYGMMSSIEQSRVTDIMHLYLQKQASEDQDALRVLKVRYGIMPPFKLPDFNITNLPRYRKITVTVGVIGVSSRFFLDRINWYGRYFEQANFLSHYQYIGMHIHRFAEHQQFRDTGLYGHIDTQGQP